MKSIVSNINSEITVNKSRFIANLIVIHELSQIEETLLSVKNKDKDASHHCYAYIIDNYKKASDDGEPSGTAGVPILNVLENNNLNHILCIVTRYFGGVKLGTGGLIRAYSKSVVEVLNKAEICELISGYNIIIEFNYNIVNDIDYLLKNMKITKKEFNENIKYTIEISKEDFNSISSSIKEKVDKLTIIDEILINSKN